MPAHDTNAHEHVTSTLVAAAGTLTRAVSQLRFAGDVAFVYNPLDYAFAPHEQYLRRYGGPGKRVLLLGMNPGPFGMMQTGVPFGEVAAVRDWMHIDAAIRQPARMHPKRPIDGWDCLRSEVSGRRLWGWAADRFGSAQAFFKHSLVINYCPLVFLAESGRNITPDKLPAHERIALQAACDSHLDTVVKTLEVEWVLGVGAWATRRLHAVLDDRADDTAIPRIGQIPHPSPASPLANRGWSRAADAALDSLGVYDDQSPGKVIG